MQRDLVFDLDGVLTRGWHYLPEKRKVWFATLQTDLGIDPLRFIKAYFGTPAETNVLTGQQTLKQTLSIVLPHVGYFGDPTLFINYWMQHDRDMNAPLLATIEKLKATGKVRCFVATNNDHHRAEFMRDEVGLGQHFDDFFFAAHFQVAKPDAAFFKACEARINGKHPAPPLFFDDNPHIVEGARKAGWEGVVYNNLDDVTRHPAIAPLLRTSHGTPIRVRAHRLAL